MNQTIKHLDTGDFEVMKTQPAGLLAELAREIQENAVRYGG